MAACQYALRNSLSLKYPPVGGNTPPPTAEDLGGHAALGWPEEPCDAIMADELSTSSIISTSETKHKHEFILMAQGNTVVTPVH